MIATTTETIDGYRISEYLGIVESRDSLYNRFRVDVLIDSLKNEAITKHNANAVIGIRFLKIGASLSESIMAYGTAVKIEKDI